MSLARSAVAARRGCGCGVARLGRRAFSASRDEPDGAAAAEVSRAEYESDAWPDGTPKRWRGRDAWKNYIDFDSPHRTQSDELNRQRIYFFHIDARGRLWRKELHKPDGHDGQMRDPRMLDFFFGHMQRNTTGMHEDRYPYLSRRAHERYFASCDEAPLVFNDLRDGELRFLCPDGALARSISTPFAPSELRIAADGKLLHPVVTAAVDEVGERPRGERLMALIESGTASRLLESCEEQGEAIVLTWRGEETVLQPLDSER